MGESGLIFHVKWSPQTLREGLHHTGSWRQGQRGCPPTRTCPFTQVPVRTIGSVVTGEGRFLSSSEARANPCALHGKASSSGSCYKIVRLSICVTAGHGAGGREPAAFNSGMSPRRSRFAQHGTEPCARHGLWGRVQVPAGPSRVTSAPSGGGADNGGQAPHEGGRGCAGNLCTFHSVSLWT